MTKSSKERILRRSVEAQTQYEMKKTFEATNQMALHAIFYHAVYTALVPPLSQKFLEAVQEAFQTSCTPEENARGLRPDEIFERVRKAAVAVAQDLGEDAIYE
jgi:hypothetical protein